MYKLAIIDDEEDRVLGIKNYINWSQYDIEVCAVAFNGRDGLDLFETYHPDIALIDIQMPYLNGLMLINEIRNRNYETAIIILSGYDNFDYAKEAIQLNFVTNYCTT